MQRKRRKKKRFGVFLFLLVVCIGIGIMFVPWAMQPENFREVKNKINGFLYKEDFPDSYNAKSLILVDCSDDEIFVSKKENEPQIPASLAKLFVIEYLGKIGVIVGEVAGILEQPELERPEKSKSVPKDNSVTLEDVRFGYHDKEILHGVTMELKAGTVNAIVGPSGSGKSTIAKLIASLWDVDSGSIKIGGVDVKEMALADFNRKIAYVAQDNYLFNETVRENIRQGNPDATDEQVVEVTKKSGCYEFIMQLENGFDTVVGGAGGHLSGGERQRISIARAMLKDAPIVILDEATAYTDPENEAILQNSIAKLVAGKTLIVIAHRLSTIKDSDQIFVVNDGNVTAHGTHEELLVSCPLYKEMWNAHISVKDTVKEGE